MLRPVLRPVVYPLGLQCKYLHENPQCIMHCKVAYWSKVCVSTGDFLKSVTLDHLNKLLTTYRLATLKDGTHPYPVNCVRSLG